MATLCAVEEAPFEKLVQGWVMAQSIKFWPHNFKELSSVLRMHGGVCLPSLNQGNRVKGFQISIIYRLWIPLKD